MKKAYAPLIAVLLLFGCQKELLREVPAPAEDQMSKSAKNSAVKHCRILKITTTNPHDLSLPPVVYTFNYNTREQLQSITFNDQTATGYPYYYFYYDNRGRVSSVKADYGRNTYEAWHFYQYDKSGRIVSDSSYFFGTAEAQAHPSEGSYHSVYVSHYTYDNQGRVTQVSFQQVGSTEVEEWDPSVIDMDYAYNPAGNLGTGYGSALNINQVDPFFMFYNRNYSINSPVQPLSVNSQNLPVQYQVTEGEPPYVQNFFSIDLTRAVIEYDCHPGKKKS